MDQLQTRLDALEQRTHTVEQQLRWWRGLAGGLLVLAVLTWALPLSIAQEEDTKEKGQKGLAQRVAALEQLLKHFSREGNEVTIKGANLHLMNGLGQTACGTEEEPILDCPNGLGNLIVGYNEPREAGEFGENIRTGSHNVVVGQRHNFSRFGGLVVGNVNTISGDFAVVSGGSENFAGGAQAVVSGGQENTASGGGASVIGGLATRPAAGSQRSAAGKTRPKRRSSAGRRARKLRRSWWATSAPRSLPRQGSSTGSPAASWKTSRGLAAVAALRAGGAWGTRRFTRHGVI
jgi:hypothetical protein